MSSASHANLMDRVYKLQRRFGFYDATRKYYLLGRDPMIASLKVPVNGSVLEIGCGTGRNLVKVAERYPTARLFGMDISREMLAAAGQAVAAAGIAERCRLALSDAEAFNPKQSFGREKFDRVYISYAVSMIPAWQGVVEQAIDLLAPGGSLHIVDFGDMKGQSAWRKSALYTWLRWYHVTPRGDLFELCDNLASRHGCESGRTVLYGGFTWIATITRPDRVFTASSVDPKDLAAA